MVVLGGQPQPCDLVVVVDLLLGGGAEERLLLQLIHMARDIRKGLVQPRLHSHRVMVEPHVARLLRKHPVCVHRVEVAAMAGTFILRRRRGGGGCELVASCRTRTVELAAGDGGRVQVVEGRKHRVIVAGGVGVGAVSGVVAGVVIVLPSAGGGNARNARNGAERGGGAGGQGLGLLRMVVMRLGLEVMGGGEFLEVGEVVQVVVVDEGGEVVVVGVVADGCGCDCGPVIVHADLLLGAHEGEVVVEVVHVVEGLRVVDVASAFIACIAAPVAGEFLRGARELGKERQLLLLLERCGCLLALRLEVFCLPEHAAHNPPIRFLHSHIITITKCTN